MIDTSTILNSMEFIKLFVKYTFNEQFDCGIDKRFVQRLETH